MDFLLALAIYASSQNISSEEATLRHQNYCQNLYFQPQAKEKMRQARCDIFEVENEVARIKSGKY